MALQPGATIGPYEIIGSLGAGGMGEVYRGRDPRLKRDVALKILPEAFAADPERLARFQREAEVLASLNHPNIAGILGLEERGTGRALVLELVEGETLADRIARGPVPFDEAIGMATQIAEALEAAHEHGIIHRDLKPANVKLRPDGTVKVLDFGLAKLAQQTDASQISSTTSLSPTITSPALATGAGVLMGTAAYMSPEQAKGRPADARSDIWSFGCVLFELVTGTRAFAGDDISDTIAGVLRGDPEWSRIPAGTPRGLTRLLKRCLARDRRQRLHGIGDARLDLQELLTPSPDVPAATIRTGLARRLLPYAITAAIVGGVVGGAVLMLRPAQPRQTQRFSIVLPDGDVYSNTGRHVVAISPAGTHIVYGANNRLNLRRLDQLQTTPIPGTEQGGRNPFFSPDGEWIGFWSQNQLMKVAVSGGAPITIASIENPTGVSWSDDGTILVSQGQKGILRVSAQGGQPETVVKLDDGSLAQSPQLLPGGEWILFTHRKGSTSWDDASIVAQAIGSNERRVIVTGGRDGRYLQTGHVVYARAGSLFGVAFNLDRIEAVGGAVPLVEDIRDAEATSGAAHFAHSMNGTLVYVPGWRVGVQGTPVWVDRDGREEKTVIAGRLDTAEHPRISPDGRRLAMIIDGDVWIYDLEGRPPIRLTQDGGHYTPVWTADELKIIFEAQAPASMLSLPSDGSGRAAAVVSSEGHFHPQAIAPDGLIIATAVDNETIGGDTDIVTFPLDGRAEKRVLIKTANREGWDGVSLSPDGRWLAYTTDATGQQEVWVQPYARPGAPVRVSPNGGREPLWARNGKELFYLEDRKLMAVAINAGQAFDFKPAHLLFETVYNVTNQPPSYDVASDGRFLMIKSSGERQQAAPIQVVLNWDDELKQRVPIR